MSLLNTVTSPSSFIDGQLRIFREIMSGHESPKAIKDALPMFMHSSKLKKDIRGQLFAIALAPESPNKGHLKRLSFSNRGHPFPMADKPSLVTYGQLHKERTRRDEHEIPMAEMPTSVTPTVKLSA
jgi:hypothetical protein